MRPHDRLRAPGGSPRVEEPQVIAGTFHSGHPASGQCLLVANRPVGDLFPTDLYGHPEHRAGIPDLVHPLGQRVIEEHCLRVSVVEHVGQFLAEIAVVDVGRYGAGLEGAELSLRVLGSVVAVESHLGVGPQTVVGQETG